MQRRVGKDIWNGLFDFYLIEEPDISSLEKFPENDFFLKNISSSLAFETPSPVVKHILSHQTIYITFTFVNLRGRIDKRAFEEVGLKKYSLQEADDLPKPVPITEYLKSNIF